MKARLLIVLLGIATIVANGQGHGNYGSMPKEGTITGMVKDAKQAYPIEYANIVLYNVKDSSITTGTITDINGKFTLKEVPFGKYYLEANFIGYEKIHVNNISVHPGQMEVQVPPIKLHAAVSLLDGVEITAERKEIIYKIDKKVIVVGKDLNAAGETAVEVLENTPSVKVDIDGNVSLRGSSSFTVLIDGRPSPLSGGDALRQIPASSIDNIEIITNPSAKYDPDGIAGIINIVLKKKASEGINGIVNVSVGTRNKYSGDFLLNYKTSKFNIYGGYNTKKHSRYGDVISEMVYTGDTTTYMDSDGERVFSRGGYEYKMGADFYLNDKTTLSLIGEYGLFDLGISSSSQQHRWSSPATEDEYIVNGNAFNLDKSYYNLTLNYQQKFEEKGHELSGMLFYNKDDGGDENIQRSDYTTKEWVNDTSISPLITWANEYEKESSYRAKIDYIRPLKGKGKIETGAQTRIDMQDGEYVFREFDNTADSMIENSLYSSKTVFNREIHSAYGMFSRDGEKFQYQIGLRGEYTNRVIENSRSGSAHVVNRMDYFPTVHLSKPFKKGDQLQVSYSRRINRPRSYYLDPYPSYMDPYTMRTGNPDLLPEYTDSYELSYLKKIKSAFVSLEGYYRQGNNMITRFRTMQSDGILMMTFANLNHDYSIGGELMANAPIKKWLNLNVGINTYYYRIEGDIVANSVATETVTWDSRVNATFSIGKNTRIQLMGFYNAPSIRAQGEMKGFLMSSLAIKREFMDKQLSTTLKIGSLLGPMKHEYYTYGEGFYSYNQRIGEFPTVSVALSYIINNYKQPKPNMNDMNGGDMEGGY